jgi:phosphoribosylformylglycinamidine synthase I
MKGDVVVIQFPGVNCEYETARALSSVGLRARIVRWNAADTGVDRAAAIVLPGGFSYQDRIRAGVVAAKDRITDDVLEAAGRGVPVLGICNGAQILVEAGVVPGFAPGAIELALAPNRMPDRGGYYCTWVRVKKGSARCVFTDFLGDVDSDSGTVPIPVAHAEGRFVTASKEAARRLQTGEGVALLYARDDGEEAESFPENPNGSLMPHPERAAWLHQVPRGVGGHWGRVREEASTDALYRPGPGWGFFESLRKGLGS